MRSFNLKTKRTKNYNSDGSAISNTFNSSGLLHQYATTNARFNSKYGPRSSCTITGCGKQCCTSNLLLSNISYDEWKTNFNYGYNLEPGHNVFLVSNTNINVFKNVGKLDDITISNTDKYIKIGPCDCSDAFPLNVEIMVTNGPNGCENIDTAVYNTVYVSKTDLPTIQLHPITKNVVITKPGIGRMGAPYRAPIGGSRKTLECCDSSSQNEDDNVPKNDIYKDMHAKYTGKVNPSITIDEMKQGNFVNINNDETKCVAYDERIRSGMQPKQQMCVTGKNGVKGNILLCHSDCGYQKPYSFSYSQYNKNRTMNTYDRGLEKNIPNASKTACPSECSENDTCCAKSLYRKSGGDACLNCTSDEKSNLMSKNSITIWKKNNDTFKTQGAVSSGGRIERLKLDTIKSANSKCEKGKRCDKNNNGNGVYFAGQPRFTGWMYNARHPERVWPNSNISAIRYRPQPLGTPQLTYKGRSTRSNPGLSNWKPHSSGINGFQRSDNQNVRAPGYGNKCVANCAIPDCNGDNVRTFAEWNSEYIGTNNARYQGNRKCYQPPANTR